jgi:hypothetical protein
VEIIDLRDIIIIITTTIIITITTYQKDRGKKWSSPNFRYWLD